LSLKSAEQFIVYVWNDLVEICKEKTADLIELNQEQRINIEEFFLF
jgi:hypothetical protein